MAFFLCLVNCFYFNPWVSSLLLFQFSLPSHAGEVSSCMELSFPLGLDHDSGHQSGTTLGHCHHYRLPKWQARSCPTVNCFHDIISKAPLFYINLVSSKGAFIKTLELAFGLLLFPFTWRAGFSMKFPARAPHSDTSAINPNLESSLPSYSFRRQHTAKLITNRTHPETPWLKSNVSWNSACPLSHETAGGLCHGWIRQEGNMEQVFFTFRKGN